MIFKESRNLKRIISTLLFGVYIFSLFSFSFHTHDSAGAFIKSNFKKADNIISKNIAKQKAGDCLACHFLTIGNTLVYKEFSITFEMYIKPAEQIIALQKKIWLLTKFTFQLRGPPTVF